MNQHNHHTSKSTATVNIQSQNKVPTSRHKSKYIAPNVKYPTKSNSGWGDPEEEIEIRPLPTNSQPNRNPYTSQKPVKSIPKEVKKSDFGFGAFGLNNIVNTVMNAFDVEPEPENLEEEPELGWGNNEIEIDDIDIQASTRPFEQ